MHLTPVTSPPTVHTRHTRPPGLERRTLPRILQKLAAQDCRGYSHRRSRLSSSSHHHLSGRMEELADDCRFRRPPIPFSLLRQASVDTRRLFSVRLGRPRRQPSRRTRALLLARRAPSSPNRATIPSRPQKRSGDVARGILVPTQARDLPRAASANTRDSAVLGLRSLLFAVARQRR